MSFDERIVPGAWVTTERWGKAVCIAVERHRHRVGPPDHLVGPDGICHCACESDACADAKLISYRYRALRCTHADGAFVGNEPKVIWVANSDLSTEVAFLAPPTRFTARILKLTGAYGEG